MQRRCLQETSLERQNIPVAVYSEVMSGDMESAAFLCVGDHWHLFYSCDFVESISIVCSKEKEFLNVGSTNI